MHQRRRRRTSDRTARSDGGATGGDRSPVRVAVLVGIVVVLLTLVAHASRGFGPESQGPNAPSGTGTTPSGAPAEYIVLAVLVGALGATLLLLAALVRIIRPRKKDDEELVATHPPPSRWFAFLATLLLAAVVAIPIGLLLWGSHIHPTRSGQPSIGAPGSAGAVASAGGGGAAGSRAPAWDWTPVVVVAGAATLLGLLLLLTRDRRPSLSVPARRRDEVAEAVDESIEDLRRDPDLRHAVIAAYARMERALATGGSPRPPSAAPFEYLEQALGRLSVPAAPARSLTELFEIAKFSRHRIDPTMKERAIDALLAVRHALTVEVAS